MIVLISLLLTIYIVQFLGTFAFLFVNVIHVVCSSSVFLSITHSVLVFFMCSPQVSSLYFNELWKIVCEEICDDFLLNNFLGGQLVTSLRLVSGTFSRSCFLMLA